MGQTPGVQEMTTTTDKDEWLSALADDELQGRSLQQGVDRLLNDPGLRQRWADYHTMREGMHGQVSLTLGDQLQQRLAATLADEPAILAPRRAPRGLMRHAAGVALAASVTGVAILGIQQMNHSDSATMPAQPASMASTQQAAPESVAQASSRPSAQPVSGPPRSDQLAPYLVNHNEYSSSTNMHGMLPYVRIVGHGSNQ